ncbi:MAG: ZIP family metal transporter [Mycobacterium sp.]
MPTSVLATVALLVVFPIVAGIAGSLIAAQRTPPPALVSGVQHLAAGVVMAAVAVEVLPDLRERGPLVLVVAGFCCGVALLVILQRFEGDEPEAGGAISRSFLVVLGVDLFVDGLLVGAGAVVSTGTAVVLTIALTLEVLFLGVATSLQLTAAGVTSRRASVITGGLTLLIGVGAILGALVLPRAGGGTLTVVLAFAAAALLWLVVEELLVEAHESPHKPWMAVMFFVGFLTIYCLEVLA